MRKIFAALVCVMTFASVCYGYIDANYNAGDYQDYVSAYGYNCKEFVNFVVSMVQHATVDSLNAADNRYLGTTREKIVSEFAYDIEGRYPTAEDIKAVFSKSQVGDVIQLYWCPYSGPNKGSSIIHTAIIAGYLDDDSGFISLESNNPNPPCIVNWPYDWEKLAMFVGEQAGPSASIRIYRFSGSIPQDDPTPAQNGGVRINEENFPDGFFRYLVNLFDSNFDGILSKEEAAEMTVLDIHRQGITSLKGIEYFTALTSLICGYNSLTELDISQNTALTYLSCDGNQLKTLDVSKNTALKSLSCGSNQLTTLDVSNNTALTHLYCSFNQLTTLDVSKNTALTELYCSANQLKTLDVSNNTALTDLGCSDNQLTVLKLGNKPNLHWLNCETNQLTEIDISGCPHIGTFFYDKNVKIIRDGSSSTGTTAEKPAITTKFKTTYIAKDKGSTILVEATGTQPFIWTTEGVPPGMFFADSLQALTGFPTTNGKYRVKISVTNVTNKTKSKSFTLHVVDPVSITTSSLPEGTFKKSYKPKLAGEGGYKLTWSAEGLPEGLKFSKSGKFSGKPKETGTFTVKITATSKKISEEFEGASDTKIFRLRINEAAK